VTGLLTALITMPLAVVLVQRVKHSDGRGAQPQPGHGGRAGWLYGITFVIGPHLIGSIDTRSGQAVAQSARRRAAA